MGCTDGAAGGRKAAILPGITALPYPPSLRKTGLWKGESRVARNFARVFQVSILMPIKVDYLTRKQLSERGLRCFCRLFSSCSSHLPHKKPIFGG
jgi:hypothetical protein